MGKGGRGKKRRERKGGRKGKGEGLTVMKNSYFRPYPSLTTDGLVDVTHACRW